MDATITLIEAAHQGDKVARERLVVENMGLVWSIVRRFAGRGYEMEDLFQIGSIGLMKAIDKFDTSFEVRFSTYAVPMITGEIKRFLRDDGMVKISRSIKENGWKLKHAEEKLVRELGREVTLEELSSETGIAVEDIVLAFEANTEIESIYKSVYQGDGNEIYLIDKLKERTDENEKLLNSIALEQILGILSENERRLIELRYFKEKTQVEVARELSVSQVQVSRMEKKILLKMREYLK
ncbi:MAG: SigF/SigG family RNA polymerase sporulation sigma factor [Lachnospiraceae bacterium]|nr:SigF/SigG family RNA polymerase sporulation sigma factor [Lachnospiraceae bacterium]